MTTVLVARQQLDGDGAAAAIELDALHNPPFYSEKVFTVRSKHQTPIYHNYISLTAI